MFRRQNEWRSCSTALDSVHVLSETQQGGTAVTSHTGQDSEPVTWPGSQLSEETGLRLQIPQDCDAAEQGRDRGAGGSEEGPSEV